MREPGAGLVVRVVAGEHPVCFVSGVDVAVLFYGGVRGGGGRGGERGVGFSALRGGTSGVD